MTPSFLAAGSWLRRFLPIGILAVVTAIGTFASFAGDEDGPAKWFWRIVATVAGVLTTILGITAFTPDNRPKRRSAVGIAYAPADQPWADWLHDRVVASDGDAQFMQIRPGSDVAQWAAEAKAVKRPTVVLLSAASALPEAELASRLDGLRRLKQATVVAQVEAQRFATNGGRATFDVDVAGQTNSAEAYALIRSELAARNVSLLPPSAKTAEAAYGFPNSGPTVELRRPTSRHFVGREDMLEKVFRTLILPARGVRHHCAVLVGPSGIGKTQIALEYAERFRARYDVIWWVSANRSETIAKDLLALARSLGMPETADIAELITQLWRELANRGQWLLVFDDALDYASVKPYWPLAANGDVLVTSTNQRWTEVADARISVPELPHDDAIQLLRQRLNQPDEVLEAILETTSRNPLFLDQAALLYEEVDLPLAEFLALSPIAALARSHQPGEDQAFQTLQDRVNRLATLAPDAYAILVQLSYFDLEMVRDVPREFAVALPDGVREIVLDNMRFGECLRRLANESYVELDSEHIRVHRLVQLAVRQSLPRERQQQAAAGAVSLLLAAFPDDPAAPANWPRCGRLLPHVVAATTCAIELGVATGQTAQLLGLAARYRQRRGEWDAAVDTWSQAIGLAERAQPPDDGRLADLLYGLGRLRYHQAAHHEARDLVGRALALHEIVDAGKGNRIADDLVTLASSARELGEFEKAIPLFERAIAVAVEALGTDHPTISRHYDSLGILQWRMSRMASAERSLRIAEKIRRDGGEACRADLGFTLKHLGMVHRDIGRVDEAIVEMEEALRIHREEFGPDHPDTDATGLHLADALTLAGRYVEASQLLDHSELVRSKTIAPDNPDMAEVYMKRGYLLQVSGHYAEAERELTKADEIYRKGGEEHHYRAETWIGLGLVRADTGRLDEAEDILNRAHVIFERTYGPSHVFLARTCDAEAHVARLRGDSERAAELEAKAAQILEVAAAA